MVRWNALIGGTVAAMGVAFATGAAVANKVARVSEPVPADRPRPPVVIGQKTGCFNVAKVMREYKRARASAERLRARKDRLAANLVPLRGMHAELQAAARAAPDAGKRFDLEQDARTVARRIEDADREVAAAIDRRTGLVISALYDELHAVVAAVAREHGLAVVLAYPDAVTPEERESPYIKELKLKPPAAQPFFLDPAVEYSDEIVRRLNERFPGPGGD
jgi:Skp family chaperone for outer membrane proteins